MCRFVAYLGSPITIDRLVTLPKHSIIKQSFAAELRSEPLNGDGFGVAWYAPDLSGVPAVFKSIQPAWSNRNLIELARVTRSGTVLAHVRAASPGLGVSEFNCHPFIDGAFAFMHNGEVGGFHAFKRRLQQDLSDESFNGIHGSTDSEHFFGLVKDRLRESAGTPIERMTQSLASAIDRVEELRRSCAPDDDHYLNLALTDGSNLVVARYASEGVKAPSLFYTEGRRYECVDGVCRMIRPPGSATDLIVASEPLSAPEDWVEVPSGHFVVSGDDHRVRVFSIASVKVA